MGVGLNDTILVGSRDFVYVGYCDGERVEPTVGVLVAYGNLL